MDVEQSYSGLNELIRQWEEGLSLRLVDPTLVLTRICEIYEDQTKRYYFFNNVDPLDYCYKHRIDSESTQARLYNAMLREGLLLRTLIEYLDEHCLHRTNQENWEINVVACRLVLNLIASLEVYICLENYISIETINQLFLWAEKSKEPLQTYATGLLAAFMESSNVFVNYIQKHIRLVPIILDRLCSLHNQFCEENNQINNDDTSLNLISNIKKRRSENTLNSNNSNGNITENTENRLIQLSPHTLTTQLYFYLKYLVLTAEYNEFLCFVYDKNIIALILKIINSSKNQNGYVTFEALKYLGHLLFHEQFAMDFIAITELRELILVPNEGIPSSGVSICLYNLSCNEKVMETISLLPNQVLNDLVQYALLLLESPYHSSRCHVVLFFNSCFRFKIIQELFDVHNGLHKIVDMINKQFVLLSPEHSSYEPMVNSTGDAIRQMIRLVCASLKNYFMVHLHIKSQEIRRAKMIHSDQLTSYNKRSLDILFEEIKLISNNVHLDTQWIPIDNLMEANGLNLLLKIICVSRFWFISEKHKNEIVKNSLKILSICSISQRVQLELCEPLCKIHNYIQNERQRVEYLLSGYDGDGLSVIINVADGHNLLASDIETQLIALSIIVTCVCAPIQMERKDTDESTEKEIDKPNEKATVETIWNCLRKNNGIFGLLKLMTIEVPVTVADTIRILACRALVGLARNDSICQIISKVPLFSNGMLQSLIDNSVEKENRLEFKKYALQLIEMVSGKQIDIGTKVDISLENINQVNIVAQTKVDFSEQQLLFLMHKYFIEKSMTETAELLVKEATRLNKIEKNAGLFSLINCSVGGIPSINSKDNVQSQTSNLTDSLSGSINSGFNKLEMESSASKQLIINSHEPEPKFESQKCIHNKIDQNVALPFDSKDSSTVSLESIVSKYLINQHASCKNPVVTCPKFDLFVPHECPSPYIRNSKDTNFAVRFSKHIHSRRLDQKFIHSKFCPTHKFIYESNDYAHFTCCEFLSHDLIAAGRSNGEVKIFSLFSNREVESFIAHQQSVNSLECSIDGTLLLSACVQPNKFCTTLWNINSQFATKEYSLMDEAFGTFSNHYQDKILATCGSKASIYNIETRMLMIELNPKCSNKYRKNRAVFDPTNKLVLSDGVLWDTTCKEEIHKIDVLSETPFNGLFHPNGNEIVSNTEVWDIRTFQLLRTVSCLDKGRVIFSNSGEGMYVYSSEKFNSVELSPTTFKTLDPLDYSKIATYDTESSLYHMTVNIHDTQLAFIENHGIGEHCDDFYVQIYDVGRSKTDDEIEADKEKKKKGTLKDKKKYISNDILSSDSDSSDSSSTYCHPYLVRRHREDIL